VACVRGTASCITICLMALRSSAYQGTAPRSLEQPGEASRCIAILVTDHHFSPVAQRAEQPRKRKIAGGRDAASGRVASISRGMLASCVRGMLQGFESPPGFHHHFEAVEWSSADERGRFDSVCARGSDPADRHKVWAAAM